MQKLFYASSDKCQKYLMKMKNVFKTFLRTEKSKDLYHKIYTFV